MSEVVPVLKSIRADFKTVMKLSGGVTKRQWVTRGARKVGDKGKNSRERSEKMRPAISVLSDVSNVKKNICSSVGDSIFSHFISLSTNTCMST